MNAYQIEGKQVLSAQSLDRPIISMDRLLLGDEPVYLFQALDPQQWPAAWHVSSTLLLEQVPNAQARYCQFKDEPNLPIVQQLIEDGRLIGINLKDKDPFGRMHQIGEQITPKAGQSVQILALGDVGATCLLALALLNRGEIGEIGIFDLNKNQAVRYANEINQCAYATGLDCPVRAIDQEELFVACDIFVFAASAGVPAPGADVGDVRQIQFEKNSKIASKFAIMAKNRGYEGLFVMLSDPVERLAQVVFQASHLDENGAFCKEGLRPEQIEGYGLGVMHSRALAINQNYRQAGRAYGRHGQGLILANHPEKYQDEMSIKLSEQVANLNMDMRALGFKPYIAPATTSGAASILAHLRGELKYSAVFIEGCYFGLPNKTRYGLADIERKKLHANLLGRIENGINSLKEELKCDALGGFYA